MADIFVFLRILMHRNLLFVLQNRPYFLLIFLFIRLHEASRIFEKLNTPRCEPLKMDGDSWTNGCGCRYSDTGEIVSLYELQTNDSKTGNPRKPRFTAHDTIGWSYSFNPCTDFNKFDTQHENHSRYIPCIHVGGARWTDESTHQCDGLGNQENARFDTWSKSNLNNLTVTNLTLHLKNETTQFGMEISLVCNKLIPANETKFTYLGTKNVPADTYYFKLESICCCPNGCRSGYIPPDKGISKQLWYIIGIGLAVLMILLFIVFATYLIRRRREKNYLLAHDDIDPLIQP